MTVRVNDTVQPPAESAADRRPWWTALGLVSVFAMCAVIMLAAVVGIFAPEPSPSDAVPTQTEGAPPAMAPSAPALPLTDVPCGGGR